MTATIDGGWFLAWWPDSSEPVQIEVAVDDEVETINLGDRYDAGGPPCRVMLLDRFCILPGGTAVMLTGVLSWWVFGYSLTTPWILASIALILGIGVLTGLYWRGYGRRANAAIAAGDAAATGAILTEPRAVFFSRIENLAVLAIVVLMVLRPS